MRFRATESKDLERIDEIYRAFHQDSFGIPSIKDSVGDGVVVSDSDEVIAFGMNRVLLEGILVLDWEASPRDKIQALKLLISESGISAKKVGIGEVHAFVQDPEFKRLLIKHFGYRPCIGDAIYMEVKHG